ATGGAGGAGGGQPTAGVCAPCADEVECDTYACQSGVCLSTCTALGDCATGYWCDTNACAPQYDLATACVSSDQCLSGSCADGVCCDLPCTGECESCDLPTAGTCTAYAQGDVGSPSCDPYLCDGTTGACPTICSTDLDCADDHYCDGLNCQPDQTNGDSCTNSTQCVSGNCVDGYCCNTACAFACDACNVTGAEGLCQAKLAGTPGDPACDPYLCNGAIVTCPNFCNVAGDCIAGHYCGSGQCLPLAANGTSCALGSECQSGFCADGVCCNTACGGPCDECDTGTVGTCELLSDGANGDPACAPFLCDGAQADCPTTCTNNNDCVASSFCNSSNVCDGKKALGQSCSDGTECDSGNCVDDVCCNTSCGNDCDACDLSGSLGVCTPMLQGSPGEPSCDPYLCNGAIATCPTTCTIDANCAGGNYCSASNLCEAKKANGQPCSAGNECTNGYCADGYCCNTACAASCDACDLGGSLGTCTVVSQGELGEPVCSPYVCDGNQAGCPNTCSTNNDCIPASYCDNGSCSTKKANGSLCSANDQCQSDRCVDGFCCNTLCSNACDACDVTGSEGTCTFMPQSSTGDPTCAPFVCNGAIATCPITCSFDADCVGGYYCSSSNSCQVKKNNGQTCNTWNECTSANCVDGYCCNTTCSGACDACNLGGSLGTCSPMAPGATGDPTCAPYECDGTGTSCPLTCTIDNDCVNGYWCNSGTCESKKALGEGCFGGNECVSTRCVDDVCCNTACSNQCDACDLSGSEGTCSPIPQGSAGTPPCSPLLCNGAIATCPVGCVADIDCVPGYWCNGSSACVSKKDDGQPCSGGNECTSSFCADGVCCNTACGGACDECDTGTVGTCEYMADGAVGDPACAPFLCDNAQAGCPTTCVNDSDCVASSFCNASNVCDGKKGLGQSCSTGTECDSGNCIDLVCCDTTCGNACDACNLAGSEGVCSPRLHGDGGDPTCDPFLCNGAITTCPTSCVAEGDCVAGNYCDVFNQCVPKKGIGASCTYNHECSSTHCADDVCCNTACAGACDECDTGTVGTCEAMADGEPGTPTCSPYLCDGTNPTCPGTCSVNADCANGFWCNAGSCDPVKAQGAGCGVDDECASGFCTDNFCCDSRCYSTCEACSAAKTPSPNGTCDYVTERTDPDGECDPLTCDGAGHCKGGYHIASDSSTGSGSYYVYPYDVAMDASDNVYVTGYYRGTVDFGCGTMASYSPSYWDVFVVKFNSAGECQWSNHFGDGTQSQLGRGIAADATGVYVTGYFYGTLDFGGGPLTAVSGAAIFFAKLSPTGAHVWSRSADGSSTDIGTKVALDSAGNPYFTGYAYYTGVDFGGGLRTGVGSYDVFIASYNGATGAHRYSAMYGGSNSSDYGWGIGVDDSNNVLLSGYFYSSNLTFPGCSALATVGSGDLYLTKLNSSLTTCSWAKRFGGTSSDVNYDLAVDSAGDAYMTGYMYGPWSFGGNNIGGPYDVYIAKFRNSDGAHQWSKAFGDASSQYGYSVGVDTNDNPVISGYFIQTIDFGGGLMIAGGWDIFQAKFASNDGAHLWSYQYGDATYSQYCYAGTAGPSGKSALACTGYGSVDFGGGTLSGSPSYPSLYLGIFTP
ncbi:MAG: hypothetical protein JRI23_25970, partial [Deltaproteobacteria bacterium]|nr:hypothetical protein [Deltaproteobacteria bacterium]MBW2535476.1 hypothetical protein [Deltaproteobacteria bacterium]